MRRSRGARPTHADLIDTAVHHVPAAPAAADGSGDGVAPFAATDPLWTTLSAAGVATVALSGDLQILWTNPAFADLLGSDQSALTGAPFLRALGVGNQDHVVRSMRQAAENPSMVVPRLSVAAVDAGGTNRELAVSASSSALVPGGLVALVEDLTAARRTANERTSAIDDAIATTIDSLTRIPNRLGFEAQLHAALRRAAGGGPGFAMLLCDVDGFAAINNRHGDALGDQVLIWVASRLTHTLRHHDTLSRLGGDQFVVIAETVTDDEIATQVARRLVGAVADPITIDGADLRISMSVGSTLARGLERANDLIVEADRALQAAKAAGPGSSRTLAQVRATQVLPTDSILPDVTLEDPPEADYSGTDAESDPAADAL